MVSGVISEMQAAAAAEPDPAEPAPIEWLPGELVAVVFCFVDIKTLMMTIPSVSGAFEWGLGGRGWARGHTPAAVSV